MGIDPEGIVNQRWAAALDRFSGGDGVVNYWIDRTGRFGSLGVSGVEAGFIRGVFRAVDALTGLKFAEKSTPRGSDIDITSVYDYGSSIIGLTTMRRGWFEVSWKDRAGTALTRGERGTIVHELGHALGLDHPYGSGFNRRYDTSDTIMSYNATGNTWFTSSDVAALQALWGEGA